MASGVVDTTPLQAARRRVPYKRRRAVSSQTASDVDALTSSRRTEDIDSSASHACKESTSSARAFPREDTEDVLQQASESVGAALSTTSRESSQQRRNSMDDTLDTSSENVDLPASTTQLLRRWWIDTESISSPDLQTTFASGLSTDVEAENRQRAQETPVTSTSTARTSSASSRGSLPGAGAVLRRLQLREAFDADEAANYGEDDSRGPDTMNYHDQLMDVFRRLNEPLRPPTLSPRQQLLSSTAMHRSTTQLSEQEMSLEGGRRRRDPSHGTLEETDTQSEVGQIISSYMDSSADAITAATEQSVTPLPSARQRALETRSLEEALSDRLSSLRAQVNNIDFDELVRRNEEIQSRHGVLGLRPRHTGSPTFAWQDESERVLVGREESESSTNTLRNDHVVRNHRTGLSPSSTQQQRPPSRGSEAQVVHPLWGEYLLSQNSDGTRTDVGSAATSALNHAGSGSGPGSEIQSTGEASHFMFQLPRRFTPSTAIGRRRVGTLGTSGRVRGPTRRLNEHWLGMAGEGSDWSERQDDQPNTVANGAAAPVSVDEEEQVMSTYRRMRFPDPEATIWSQEEHGEESDTHALQQPPQLPSLRSRSPLALPYPSLMGEREEQGEVDGRDHWSDSVASRQASRPLLRPLTLSSRVGPSLRGSTALTNPLPTSPLRARSGTSASDAASSTASTDSSRRAFLLDRTAGTTWSSERGTRERSIDGSGASLRIPSRLRTFFDQMDDDTSSWRSTGPLRSSRTPREEASFDDGPATVDSFTSRRDQRSASDRDEREHGSNDALRMLSSSHSARRSAAHPVSRTLRQRESSWLDRRRRPTLLDADSSAVDMELPTSERIGVDDSGAGREQEMRLPLMARHLPRPASRWDRYLEEAAGASSGIRSILEAHALDGSPSSSLLNPSRYGAESSFAASLRSEIAMNPANYVADDDFALRDTYEGLLQLSARIGDVQSKVTPAHVIAKLPVCLYAHWLGGSCDLDRDEKTKSRRATASKGKARQRPEEEASGHALNLAQRWSNKDKTCSICLESYAGLDTIMSLPCNHAFHETCLVTWLKSARTCPCCRGDVGGREEKCPSIDAAHPSPHQHPSSTWLRILPELNF